MTHTPGPWVWSGNQLLAERDMASETVLVAHVGENGAFEPTDADKAIAAAAPDMLAALKDAETALKYSRPLSDSPEALQRHADTEASVRAAIAKATEVSK